MKPATIGKTTGLTITGLVAGIWLIGHMPGVPYNLRELVAGSNPLIQGILLSGALYALFGLPALITALARSSIQLILRLPMLLLAETALLWLFLREGVPAESIHDILGTPVLQWPWEWEYLFRLSGIVFGFGTMLAGAALLAARRRLVAWLVVAVPLLALSHWIIVAQAATDNLTELMAAGGGWRATLFIALWIASVGLAGSTISLRLASGRPARLAVTLVAVASFPVAYFCLWLGLEQEVHKYNQVFSGLQFLLSPDRRNLASGLDLVVRFAVFHGALISLIAVFQYPFWAWRATAHQESAGPRSSRRSRAPQPGILSAFAAPLAYGGLLVYGTLFPFDAWQAPRSGSFLGVLSAWPDHVSLADVFTNAVIYLPFGFLLAIPLRSRLGAAACIGLVSLAGLLLSWTLEYLQFFIPYRNTSNLDLGLNLLGTTVGAWAAVVMSSQHAFGHRLLVFRNTWFHTGRASDVALAALGLWLLSWTIPLVPSLDVGNLRQGVAPLWATLRNPASFSLQLSVAYTLSFFGMGQLVLLVARSGRRARSAYTGLLVAMVLLGIPVVGRSLEAEALAALFPATILLYALGTDDSRRGALLASIAIVTAYIARNLYVPAAAAAMPTRPFDWVPFAGQMSNVIGGLDDILANAWPFVALAYFSRIGPGRGFHRSAASGTVLIFLAVLAINLLQQFLPGRYPDITDAIVAASAWWVAWIFLRQQPGKAAAESRLHAAATTALSPQRRRHLLVLAAGAALAVSVAGLLLKLPASVPLAPERPGPGLPDPLELPPASLAEFRSQHPRLPAPSAADISVLRSQKKPVYLEQLARKAEAGKPNLDAAVTLAYLEPGSQDLDNLLDRLLAVRFRKRASGELKSVVKAYDWLYQQWGPDQSKRLRSKVADACEHEIRYIREEQLSPYNVILYNTLFQDLMACAIALYGDDPRGDPVMAFAYDLLKNRVLPVWRQIMGNNGGWHEGGEYVAIGIGRAVYQVPAMWRKATGEDLFRSEPEIRGFLDFLVYRVRPDRTQFRWGDGAFFRRRVPDRIPLAIEYRDAAAYSLNGCPRRVEPTAWPWGPLPDDSLCDPGAISQLPLSRYFDGIGLLVARSDWSPDATYVTFRAGDNYWSHTHLDQGAFTIYKGGALAIDSGAYGGGKGYGSDHHMNYAYQSIAHNTITVRDPEDTVPAPRDDKEPRHIANDGGQRRVGSGWGIEAAPLDLAEWQQKREIYHTGRIEKQLLSDGLVVAVSDITPAYTNRYSGEGTFSHRTRRVERLWRTFGYDSVDDVIVVFDQLRTTRPEFEKRWLLHSIEAPRRNAHGFTISVVPSRKTGHSGGRLEGHVLLPQAATLKIVGGARAAFLADGTNYDEGGALEKQLARRRDTEPGAWRIELSPAGDSDDTLFLVVMLPSLFDSRPSHRVRLLHEGERVGCEIEGPERTTRWWFKPGRNGVDIELVSTDGETRHYPLWTEAGATDR